MHLDALDAVGAGITAMIIVAALTPPSRWLARRIGAIDVPDERGLSDRAVPRLGGPAMLTGVLIAAVLWLPVDRPLRGILLGSVLITLIGAVDDVRELPPGVKLVGQVAAALILVLSGVVVSHFTLPFIHHVELGAARGPLTLLGLIAVMNAMNLTDGVDGLAAGIATIAALAFAVVASDLGRNDAVVLAATVAGASAGFLFFNFPPASVFMGDSGSNLLGLLLGAVVVQGELKKNALLALIAPAIILAVPLLDTGFVVLKRIKYRRPVYRADAWHFHHRFSNIGFSRRRTLVYLYGWTISLAALAVAQRFVKWHDRHDNLYLGGTMVMLAFGVVALAASLYVIYVLEIVTFRRLRGWQLRRLRPESSEPEIAAEVQRELETGEFDVVATPDAELPRARHS